MMSNTENEHFSGDSDEESVVDDEFEELQNDFAELTLKPYQYEPEKITEDHNETFSDHTSESEDESYEPESSVTKERAQNLDWCQCDSCKKESREIDCLCCQEVAAISEDKFSGEKCATLSQEFATICLTKVVLQNVLVSLHETRGDYLEKEITNRSYRFAAYKQFVWWIFQRLGKGNRRVLPSCVIWKIRQTFPEEGGEYTLYNEGGRD